MRLSIQAQVNLELIPNIHASVDWENVRSYDVGERQTPDLSVLYLINDPRDNCPVITVRLLVVICVLDILTATVWRVVCFVLEEHAIVSVLTNACKISY